MPAHDLIIRGGLVVDGGGGAPFEADVAVDGGVISAIGKIAGSAAEEIDARGQIVTPGFVDIHTHYDGQITWEHRLAPSSGHGVTTVVMGNCGVGFAPVRAGDHDLVIRLMEGVEDIPEAVMATGVPWNWESFPQYLDAIEARASDIDFAAQLPHNPLRVYVMGERGAAREPPTVEELRHMRRLTAEAIGAGALGVTTTRNLVHRFRSGESVPSVLTEADEVMALAAGLRDAGAGVFQLLGDTEEAPRTQMDFLTRIAQACGRPVSFTLTQDPGREDGWREMLALLERANAAGHAIRGQVLPRPVGMLMGLELSLHPFALKPGFRAIADLPLAAKVAKMADPELRARLIAEAPEDPNPILLYISSQSEWLFVLGDPPNYNPAPGESLAARARAQGREPMEVIYDALLERDGREILYFPAANRAGSRFEEAGAELIRARHTVLGLGDGGAHYGIICDASYPTYLLTHWARHPDPDRRISHAEAIRMLAREPARAVGLDDRGEIALGMKADINVIDPDRLRLHAPRPRFDLPAGGRRLTQKADGFAATIVSGAVTYRDGEASGALPGHLVRGAQPTPPRREIAA
ncbi:MAG TPA: amidohydrolase family protein [Caulobacteraceae bacterium]|jgi:N-acyl-D-aspartate/D-glutamate deacylase|nr:amidohydrolase family protein [Caulobacteraceae bacterium]